MSLIFYLTTAIRLTYIEEKKFPIGGEEEKKHRINNVKGYRWADSCLKYLP